MGAGLLLGGLTGVLMLASAGMMPASTLIAGAVIHLTGPRAHFPLAAATVALAAAAQLRSRLARARAGVAWPNRTPTGRPVSKPGTFPGRSDG